jgi:hypothetical protein
VLHVAAQVVDVLRLFVLIADDDGAVAYRRWSDRISFQQIMHLPAYCSDSYSRQPQEGGPVAEGFSGPAERYRRCAGVQAP